MHTRHLVRGAAVPIIVCGLALSFGSPALAQSSAHGQPDIQGVWTNFDPTPFEAPNDIDLERLAPLAAWFPGSNQPQRPPAEPNPDARAAGPSGPWGDGPGDALRNERRQSMVVDPPNGRVPLRRDAITSRNNNLINLTDGWLTHTPWERCITRGIPGGMFPGGYGAGYQIMQVPGYVVIFYEMIHEARVIPITDRPALPDNIRLWNGDARGRWEGDTLIVETGNYNDQGTIGTNIASRGVRGIEQSEALTIVERFTRVDDETISYSVRIDDPKPFTAPWTVAMPLNRDNTYQIYEYACHEGNYGLENSLRSGRAEDETTNQP
jgi:hypothetical protein